MSTESIIQSVEKLAEGVLSAEPEYFLIEIKVKPTNNIRVYLDGDQGITIEKCVYFNKLLYKQIEAIQLFPDGDFSLEVSSPGVDKPLKLQRQYTKNLGRNVEIVFNDGAIKEGKLLQTTSEDVIIEQTTGKGKKAETQQVVIPFSNIKTITVQIKF